MTTVKDAYDLWWEWATKDRATDFGRSMPRSTTQMMLTPEERKDRAIVNETVRTMSPLREAGSADEYGVRKAEE
jgi:hypothetical protein